MACFRKALELQPQSSDARAGLGRSLWLAGRRQEGIETLQEAIRRNQNEPDAWYGMGVVHLTEGRPRAAIDALSRAASLKPHSILICSDLGVAFSRDGQWREAIAWQLMAVQDEEKADRLLEAWNGQLPTLGSFPRIVVLQCRLAFACNNLGDRLAAKHWYQAALARDPDWPQKIQANALSLATSPDYNARDAQLAYELASQATEAIADPPAEFLDNLAAAQAALGKYKEAVQTAQQAVVKAAVEGNQSQANRIRVRLRLYEQGKPRTP
jgi:tetratricopeptide (TPR) repeat protein